MFNVDNEWSEMNESIQSELLPTVDPFSSEILSERHLRTQSDNDVLTEMKDEEDQQVKISSHSQPQKHLSIVSSEEHSPNNQQQQQISPTDSGSPSIVIGADQDFVLDPNNKFTREQLLDFENVKLSSEQRVMACVEFGYLQELKTLLTHPLVVGNNSQNGLGLDVNVQFRDKTKNDRSLLHIAARYGQVPIIQYLVDELGANPNTMDKTETTPIFLAAAHGHTETCHALCSKGANVNMRDVFENFPLGVALSGGFFETAEALLLFGADVNFKGKKGNTALHDACEANDWKRVQFLLSQKGVNIPTKNRFEESCLFSSLLFPSLLYRLCERFNRDYPDEFQRWIRAEDQLGKTLLHICAQNGYFISFCVVLSFIPPDRIASFINAKDRVSGNTVLHYIVSVNNASDSEIGASLDYLSVSDDTLSDNTPSNSSINIGGMITNGNNGSSGQSSPTNTPSGILDQKCYLYSHDNPIESFFYILISSYELNVDEQNLEGETALHLALRTNPSWCGLLVSIGGANMKIENKQHKTAKKIAKECGISIEEQKDSNRLTFILKKIKKTDSLGGSSNTSGKLKTSPTLQRRISIDSDSQSGSSPSIGSNGVVVMGGNREQLVQWTKHLECGLPAVDNNYARIFDMINHINRLIFRMCKSKTVSPVDMRIGEFLFGDILGHLLNSFDAEKRLLTEYCMKYPYFDSHLKDHEKIVLLINNLTGEFKQTGSEQILEELLFYMTSHVTEHFLQMDRKLAWDVKAIRMAPLSEENELMLEFI